MSQADLIYRDTVLDILNNGVSDEDMQVRPHWEDGTPAHTIKQFGVVNRYDLRKEFPALTFRRTPLKTCMKEILWIYQKKSNNIHDLGAEIWDEWADETGSIGKAYGYQIAKKYAHHPLKETPEGTEDLRAYPSAEIREEADGRKFVWLDQMDGVLYDLKNTPYSRRIMTNVYNFDDLKDMGLYPCAFGTMWDAVKYPGEEKMTLNLTLMQRSNDMLCAGSFNPCEYAILLMMVAQVCDMIPGQLVHIINNAHIYLPYHKDLIEELVSREPLPAPKVRLNPEVKDFYAFTTDDLIVEDYQTGPQIRDIPVAI